jgi:hypothetical protein
MTTKLITLPEISEKNGVEESQLRKQVKNLGLKTVRVFRLETKKSATAITLTDLDKLVEHHPEWLVGEAKSTDIPLARVAEEIAKLRNTKPDISSTLRMCEVRKIEVHVAKVGNRAVKCLSSANYKKLMEEMKQIA